MVIRRKSDQLVTPIPVPSPTPPAPTLSFFDYLRDLGVSTEPDLSDPRPSIKARAIADHRDMLDELRADYYVEVAEGRIIEPDAVEDPEEVKSRTLETLPTEWTWNEGKGQRSLIPGMELRLHRGDAIWRVKSISPTGATVVRISGESPLPPLTVISLNSILYYRREQTVSTAATTTGSGLPVRRRKRSGVDTSSSGNITSRPRKRRTVPKKRSQ